MMAGVIGLVTRDRMKELSMSAAAHEPAPASGLRDRLRDETDNALARSHFENMLRRVDEGAEIFTAGRPPWMASSAAERAEFEAEQQTAIEAARRGELPELGQTLAEELHRRGRA